MTLDATFAALADPTRRAILARLSQGEATLTELASPFAMSVPAISKHLRVLEAAGLISRGRDAQRKPCRLEARPLREVADWVERYRKDWEESFERLDDLLEQLGREEEAMANETTLTVEPGQPTIVISRWFDAPRARVFDACTRPEHLRRWWGPRANVLIQCDVDLRPGGRWRFVQRGPDGTEHGFGGEYREVVRPEKVVQTFVYDGFPQAEAVETAVFADERGGTRLTVTVLHQSVAFRDGHVASGMEGGMRESHDRLAELLRA